MDVLLLRAVYWTMCKAIEGQNLGIQWTLWTIFLWHFSDITYTPANVTPDIQTSNNIRTRIFLERTGQDFRTEPDRGCMWMTCSMSCKRQQAKLNFVILWHLHELANALFTSLRNRCISGRVLYIMFITCLCVST